MPAQIIDGALTRELRRSVLRPELSADDPLPGDDVDEVVHFGVLDADGSVLSTCFVFRQPCPWNSDGPGWHLRQMATEPEARGRGLAATILVAVVDYVAANGGGVLWCLARDTALTLYQRAGFVVEGEPFIEQAVPHLRMARTVEPA